MSTTCVIYIFGIIVSLILTLILFTYYRNHNDSGEAVEFLGFAAISLLSWIGVILLVFEFRKQIKEMLYLKEMTILRFNYIALILLYIVAITLGFLYNIALGWGISLYVLCSILYYFVLLNIAKSKHEKDKENI